jgi:hypothetical protein
MVAKKPKLNLIEQRPARTPEMTEEEFMERLKEWPEKVDELIKRYTSKISSRYIPSRRR